ncbi:MAG: PAS domain S-box protein [Elusimicrobiota bacterium]
MKDKNNKLEINDILEYNNRIIATLREPFLILNKDLRIISANRAFYTKFKISEKETVGYSINKMGNKQWNIPKLLTLLKEILPKKKIIKDYEITHKFEQIGKRVLLLNARRLRIPKGTGAEKEEELILLAMEDITERRRIKKALEKSEERFRRAFETSKDALLLVHKTQGKILEANESAQDMFGYPEKKLLQKKLWEIGVTEDCKDFQKTMLELERDGVCNYNDTTVKTEDDTKIKADVFLVDRAQVAQCNIRDITERANLEKFRSLFQTAPDPAYVAGKDGTFLEVNEAFIKNSGYGKEELEGKSFLNTVPFLSEKDRQKVVENFKKRMKGEHLSPYPLKFLTKNGETRNVEVNASPIKKDGQFIGEIGIARDVTERKQSEEKRRKLKDALDIKSKFTSLVTHELRTPLSVIKESLGIVLEENVGELNDTQIDFLSTAKNNLNRLHRFINDVLTFSKLESGKMALHCSLNDLNVLVSKIMSSYKSLMSEDNLIFKIYLDENLKQIYFDADRIEQVLENLVTNAIKYTDRGYIEAHTGILKAEDEVFVKIKDTGRGIAEGAISKIFSEYEQLEKSGTDQNGSSGLGLTISKEIIEQHGGTLSVQSKKGEGSVFTFTLPAKYSEE